MAKKNLSALMDGLISSPSSKPEAVEEPISATPSEDKPADPTPTRRRPGRPALGQDTPVRTTFLFSPSTLNKLRYISLVDKVSLKDIIEKLVSGYIAKWEKNNGEIPEAVAKAK